MLPRRLVWGVVIGASGLGEGKGCTEPNYRCGHCPGEGLLLGHGGDEGSDGGGNVVLVGGGGLVVAVVAIVFRRLSY